MTDQANSTQYMGTPEKLTAAMLQGLNNLPEGLQKGFQEQLQSLKDPKTQAVLGGVVAAWGALHLVGVGEAADLGLLGLGYAALRNDAITATKELASFVQAANEAQVSQNMSQPAQQQKLAEASKHFEKFVEIVGVDGVALLVGAKAGEVSTKLANSLKENAGKLSQLPAEAGRLLNAAQEQLSGLTRGLQESAEGGWKKLAGSLDELLGRKPVTPEGVTVGPLKMEGRGPGGSGSAWISKAVEGIKNTHGEKVAQLVKQSLDKLISPLGAEGANRAAQNLEVLSTKTIPELAEKLSTLQRHIGEGKLGSVQIEKLSSDINKSLNSIKDHLKPDDLVGALRDRLGDPVKIRGKIYDHNDEVSTGIDSLKRAAGEINKALQWHKTPAAVKGELSELSTYINSVIERVEKFRAPATHQALIQQSNPTVVAQQTSEQTPSNRPSAPQEQLLNEQLASARNVTQELASRTESNSQNLREVLSRIEKITAERTPASAAGYLKTWSQNAVSANILKQPVLNEQEQTSVALAFTKKWLDQSGKQDVSGRTVAFAKDYAAAHDGQTMTIYRKDTYLPLASYDRSSQIVTLERPLDPTDRNLAQQAQQQLLAEQQRQTQVAAQPQREIGGYGDG
jgi:hypothetical protein